MNLRTIAELQVTEERKQKVLAAADRLDALEALHEVTKQCRRTWIIGAHNADCVEELKRRYDEALAALEEDK